jgi:hypothetical protein
MPYPYNNTNLGARLGRIEDLLVEIQTGVMAREAEAAEAKTLVAFPLLKEKDSHLITELEAMQWPPA